jgi:hypothetical protein
MPETPTPPTASPSGSHTTPTANPDDQVIHQMYVGGVSLVRDGRLMANAGACAVYENLSYAVVQGMWRFLAANPRIQQVLADFNRVSAEELTNLGDALGLVRGVLTQEDLANNRRTLENWAPPKT